MTQLFSHYPADLSEVESGGSSTTVLIVVINVIGVIAVLALCLVLRYNAKSAEITPVTEKAKSEAQTKSKARKKKIKHPISPTGLGDKLGADKTFEDQGVVEKKKRRRRKPSKSSPKISYITHHAGERVNVEN